jgi:hypothetical protein
MEIDMYELIHNGFTKFRGSKVAALSLMNGMARRAIAGTDRGFEWKSNNELVVLEWDRTVAHTFTVVEVQS